MDLHSEDNYVYGVYAMNASTDRRDDNSNMKEDAKETAKVVINAENTSITASAGTAIDPEYKEHRAIGIVAMSEGEVEINGNLFVKAGTAVLARGKAVVNINKDKKADTIVQLNGDINIVSGIHCCGPCSFSISCNQLVQSSLHTSSFLPILLEGFPDLPSNLWH